MKQLPLTHELNEQQLILLKKKKKKNPTTYPDEKEEKTIVYLVENEGTHAVRRRRAR